MNKLRALVTGGSGGIGSSISEYFESHGVEVERPTRSELDLSKRRSVDQYVSSGLDFDILVNNAGINHLCAISDLDLENWDKTIEVNLTSSAILMKACLGAMRKKKWGRIVNVASIYGRVVREHRGIYSATKAALIHLSATLAIEEAKHGILVNTVSPGFVNTPLTSQNNSPEKIKALVEQVPMGRLAEPS